MKYYADLKIEKSKMNFLTSLLSSGYSIEEANKIHGTNYGTKENIFSKKAYFEDGTYVELSIYTESESILCSLYIYTNNSDDYTECDDEFIGDFEFLVDNNLYKISVSSIENEFLTDENFSTIQNNGHQEYFNIKCIEGSIDVLRNKDTDIWFGIIHYNKGGDMIIPNVMSKSSEHAKQLVCNWYNEN